MSLVEQTEAWSRARDASRLLITTLGRDPQVESSHGSSNPSYSASTSYHPPPPPAAEYATGTSRVYHHFIWYYITITFMNLLF